MDKGIYKKPTLYKRGPRAGRRRRVLLLLGWYLQRRRNDSPSLRRLPVGEARQGDATHSHWTH